jgi:integrase/recombinase XerD
MVFEYKREPLEDYEMEQLRKNCKSFDEELVVNVLLETGLRVSELAGLREDNCSWQRSCITLIGKGNKRRVIPMSNTTRFYLTAIFKDQPKIHLASRTIQKYVQNVAERARIKKKVSPHVLRHTFAVCYLHRGGNLRALQSILGHGSISTTDVYLNYSGERVIQDFQRTWENKEPAIPLQESRPDSNTIKSPANTQGASPDIVQSKLLVVKPETTLLKFIDYV